MSFSKLLRYGPRYGMFLLYLWAVFPLAAYQRESEPSVPIAFTKPPLEALYSSRQLDFGLVDVGTTHQDTAYHLMNLTQQTVTVALLCSDPSIQVQPTHVVLPPGSGTTQTVTVTWQASEAMVLDALLIFDSFINEVSTGQLTWTLQGKAGMFHLEEAGQRITSLDFGQVALGQSATRHLTVVNHVGDSYPLNVSTAHSELQVTPTLGTLPGGGNLNIQVAYTPTQPQLQASVNVSGSGFQMDLDVTGTSQGVPELALFDAQGQPISTYDFGEFTVKVDQPEFELEVRNIGTASTGPEAAITGFDFPTALIFCTSGEIGICAQDTATGAKPDLRNMMPGESRTLRFNVLAEESGTFSREFSFLGGSAPVQLTLFGHPVPFLLPRWTGGVIENGSAPSNGDYLTNPMGPKLAQGLGVNKVFALDEIDNINLFNGNLVLRIPLGSTYPAGGKLSYGFQLTYNANAWDVRFKQEVQPPGEEVTATVVSPDPKSNAGLGFSLHMGRLFEPVPLSEYNQLSQTEQEKLPYFGADWVYIGPDNATHTFYPKLHEPSGYQPNANVSYTRDGSYLRMVTKGVVNGFLTREIQFGDGTVHTYQRREDWGDVWPDKWRLISIADRTNNTITVTYHQLRWEVRDRFGRTQVLKFEGDSYWGMRVKQLELTAFGGQTAIYGFQYVPVTAGRPGDTFLGHNSSVNISLLTRIVLPDQTTYEFQQPGGHFRMEKVTLPTDATIEWEYGFFTFPFGQECKSFTEFSPPEQWGVTKRTVSDQNENVMDTRQFLRGFYKGTAIQPLFCSQVYSDYSQLNPYAEMVVGVFSPTATQKGRLDLNYFSVWPFGENALTGFGANGGWTNREFGRPFSRNHPDPQNAKRFLSARTYSLEVGTLSGSPDPEQLAQTGELLRSKYVAYEQEGSFCNNLDPSDGCSDVNARVTKSSVVYHNDGNLRAHTDFNNFDGLGHFRRRVTSGGIGNDFFKYVTDYHPWRGELILNEDGSIASGSTFTLPNSNDPWILNTYVKKTVEDPNGVVQGSKYCFQSSTGLLLKERTWKTGTYDGPHDVVRTYDYNYFGELTESAVYGGDVQTLPTGSGCNHNFNLESDPQGPQFKTVNTYQKGVLKTSKFDGFSHFLTNNTEIDANTSLVKTSTDASGTLPRSQFFDKMGRLVKITSPHDANQVFVYKLPGVNWTKPPRVMAYQYKQGTTSGAENRLTEQTIYYDNLGRILREDERHPAGYFMRTNYGYNQRGWVTKETTTQRSDQFDHAKATRYEYDIFGNATKITKPDGSVINQIHRGIREVEIKSKVGTHLGSNNQILQSDSVQYIRRNRQGNITSVETPLFTTQFSYNPKGALIQSKRGSQTRNYTVDGRGFMTAEQLPEKGPNGNGFVLYQDFDAMGNVGLRTDGDNQIRYTYDRSNRLMTITDAQTGDPILERHYSDAPGITNGLLETASRYNRVTPENTGGALTAADTRVVTEDYFYGHDGRMNQRDTLVTTGSGLEVVSFTQAWTYDDLGKPDVLTYPSCTTPDCWDPARTVQHVYNQGRLTAVAPGQAVGASVSYHDNGMTHQITHENGLVDTYQKPASGLARPLSIQLASGQMDLGVYEYDGMGNAIKIGTDVYLYDLNSRLIRGDIPGGPVGDYREYSYDIYDNLELKGPDQLMPNPLNNRLPNIGYDTSGNTTEVDIYKMFYDQQGFKESMIHNPNQNQNPCSLANPTGDCWVYLYGPDNLRIGGISLMADQSGDYFWTVRDLDGKVLRSYSGLTGTLRFNKDFIYTGSRLVATKEEGVNSQKHLHSDHLGSPRAASDRWGNFLGSRHFMAFGTPTGTDGVVENIVDWTGHEKDPNELTHYMKARSYFNGWGRFLTPDPARDGWNLYTYAENNPMNRVDPLGLDSRELGRNSDSNECIPGEDPNCSVQYLPRFPFLAEPENPTSYSLGGGDKYGPIEAKALFFLEFSDGKVTNGGLNLELSAKVSGSLSNLFGIAKLPFDFKIKPSGEGKIKVPVPVNGRPSFVEGRKQHKIVPRHSAEANFLIDTPVSRTVINADGVQTTKQYNLVPLVKATGKAKVSGSVHARDILNAGGAGANAFFSGLDGALNWVRTCGGFCNLPIPK